MQCWESTGINMNMVSIRYGTYKIVCCAFLGLAYLGCNFSKCYLVQRLLLAWDERPTGGIVEVKDEVVDGLWE